jgi:hypothetical protein
MHDNFEIAIDILINILYLLIYFEHFSLRVRRRFDQTGDPVATGRMIWTESARLL